MLKLKIVKQSDFTSNEVEHTHYTVAYKGRLFGLSTMRVERENITVQGDTISLKGDYELLADKRVDQLTGEVTTFVNIVPKLDLAVSLV